MTPGSVIRAMGPWGSGLVHGYARRRHAAGIVCMPWVHAACRLFPCAKCSMLGL